MSGVDLGVLTRLFTIYWPDEGTGIRLDYLVNRDDQKNEGPFGENSCTEIERPSGGKNCSEIEK